MNDERFRAMLSRLLDPGGQDDPIDAMLPFAIDITTYGPANPSLAFEVEQYGEVSAELVIDEAQRSALLAVLALWLRSPRPELPPSWVFFLLNKLSSDVGVAAGLRLMAASRTPIPQFNEGSATQLVIYLSEFVNHAGVAVLREAMGELKDWPGAWQLAELLRAYRAGWFAEEEHG